MKPGRRLESLWSVTATDGPVLPPFEDATTDVVIVGAGLTGLSAALHLAEHGSRVTVLDGEAPGWGTSGQSGGQVIAGLHAAPDDIVANYGPHGEAALDFLARAPDLIFDLIGRHGIDCHPVRGGWIQANRSRRGVRELHRQARMWTRRGAPVELLDRQQTERLTGTGVYAGGWLDRRNGTVQPLAYTRGLAAAALRRGARIHAGAEVLRLRREATTWRVETTAGQLACSQVLVCTNAFTGNIVPRLARSILAVHGVQIASAPLPEAVARTILPQGHSCADNHKLRVRYFRIEPDRRLVIGGPGWLTPPRDGHALSFRILERSARAMFPQIGDVGWDYRWYGRGAMTADLLPHIHEVQPGLLAALGYNGRGIAAGTAFGTVLARRALGESPATLPIPFTPLSALPFSLAAAAPYYASIVGNAVRRRFAGLGAATRSARRR